MNATPCFRELMQGSLEEPNIQTLCKLVCGLVYRRTPTIGAWRNVALGRSWDDACRECWFWAEALAERISDQESKEDFHDVKNVLRTADEAEQLAQRLLAAGGGALSAADIAAAPAEDVTRFFACMVRFKARLAEGYRGVGEHRQQSRPSTAGSQCPWWRACALADAAGKQITFFRASAFGSLT